VIRIGLLLAVGGLVGYAAGLHHAAPPWWLVPPGLLAAGAGVLLAGVVAAARRRLLPFRAARRAAGTVRSAGGPVRRLRAVPAMVLDAWRGRATLSRSQTVLWLAAVVYLVSPLDALATVLLPLVGVTGDIGLVAWLLASLYAEAGHYVAAREGAPRRDAPTP
jgi:uncharacterized membrane protein YkvA (DUF1232 family)